MTGLCTFRRKERIYFPHSPPYIPNSCCRFTALIRDELMYLAA